MISHVYRYIFALFAAVLCLPCASGAGFVKVRNFPKEAYSGGPQNWAVVQDSLGRIYVGNRDGMLVFDGARWRKAYLPNYTTVRSLLFDPESNRIYAGGSEEIGYFSPDISTGALRYTSLLDRFPQNHPQFSEIWEIFKNGESVWFQADNYLFCLSDDNIRVFPVDGRISASALVGTALYVALEDGRLLVHSNGNFRELRNSSALRGKRITSMLPFYKSGDLLIGTSVDGLYRYDGTQVAPYPSEINDFLKANQMFCAATNGSTYVFGTVNSGAVAADFTTGFINYINKETGLQNNTVLNAGFDRSGNLWLCLDNGLDYALYNSPASNLISRNNSIGAGYASMNIGDHILYGTNQGLFSTEYPYLPSPTPKAMRRELQGQVWSITPSAHGVFVATDAGIYVLDGGVYTPIEGIHGAYKVESIPSEPDKAVASTYDAFHLLQYSGRRWHDAGPVKGYGDINGNFIYGSNGNLWLPHWRKGIYRLHLDPATRTFDQLRLYDSNDGLPTNHNNTAAEFDGRTVFSTQGGFYTLSETPGAPELVPYEELNDAFSSHRGGPLQSLPDGSLALVDNSGISIASRRADGSIGVRNVTIGNISDELVAGYTHINYVSPDELIVSTQDGFICVNLQQIGNDTWSPMPFISAVYVNRDSIVYSSSLSKEAPRTIELPFDRNSLRFEFAYPDFDLGKGIEYSSYLENYEADWSPFSDETSREYTRLSEGDYTMHLRVRDINTGEIRQASIGLKVFPPWFRTPLAKALYAIGALLFLGLLFMAVRKWADNARRQLERRKERELQDLRTRSEQEAIVKDYEIASLKTEQLEQDIKHKSHELSNTTMNLIRKNEMLSDIAAQISNIQQLAATENSRAALQRQLAKIQTSIENSISRDNDWNAFNKNFDVVYGDYTKRLMELHPNLSTADKRLCCYIRMGLSSKEIAPLINISYKSVEMARYRLRKKINLSGEVSLTDYLTNL